MLYEYNKKPIDDSQKMIEELMNTGDEENNNMFGFSDHSEFYSSSSHFSSYDNESYFSL